MSVDTSPVDFEDLYTALLDDMRSNTSQTDVISLAKRYIDTANKAAYHARGELFGWAERHAFIKTHAEYSDGTLTATIGTGTLTGASTAWNTNNSHGQPNMRAGGKLVIDDQREVYEVLTVPSDTSATMQPDWIGETEAALTYRYFEDEYALASDFLKPVDQHTFDDDDSIHLVGRTDFRRAFPRNSRTTTHITHAIIQDHAPSGNTTPIRKIRFAPAPSNTQIIRYTYVTSNIVVSSAGVGAASFSADTDEPTMPLRWRSGIVVGAKAKWYRDLKDDARAASCEQEWAQWLNDIVGDQDIGAQRMRMRSPGAMYRARAKRGGGRTGNRRFDDGRFDTLRDRDR